MNKIGTMGGLAMSAAITAFAALLFSAALLVTGCSSGVDDAPKFDGQLGEHPQGYINDHWSDFLTKPNQCETCHGSAISSELAGGVSGKSCFSCHVNGVSHTPGYDDSFRHGRNSAQSAPGDNPAVIAGFASCQRCHGEDYRGVGIAVSCMSCHTRAPHPNRPWTGRDVSHRMTAEVNMPACAKCHTRGENSSRKPALPPPEPNTRPTCYNGALCHM
ncbi:MAG: hypothetical protein LBQ86_05470 [Holophagales bacterium]|nr:hypothetical protein [Holophagales bacterium]